MSARDVIGHALRVYYADSRNPEAVVAVLLKRFEAEVLAQAAETASPTDGDCNGSPLDGRESSRTTAVVDRRGYPLHDGDFC
ncbi:hypothetical protein [Streptomyces malaysiensis]